MIPGRRFNSPWLFVPCWLAFALLPPGCAIAGKSVDPFQHARELFERAYAQVDAQDEPRHADSETLRTYPLYPYLQAARIGHALTKMEGAQANSGLSTVDQRAQTFTTYYEGQPVGRQLRRAWLASLAQRQQWTTFLDQYRDEIADAALQCQRLTARIALGRTADLEADIASRWLTPKSLPECEHPFDWLRSRNALSPELIEQRAKLALEENNTGFARQIAAMLPRERAAPLLQWADLIDNPRREVDALIAAPDKAVDEDALLAGWTRLARADRDEAIERIDKLVRARHMTREAASPYVLALALALSWDRRPEALQYFGRVAAADLDDYALEWQTRAALWAGDWQRAGKSIAAMSDEQREDARWRYWAGRAAEQGKDEALAQQLYRSVLVDDNFYSMMAAARLDQPLAPHPQKLLLDEEQMKEVGQLPSFVRAHELLRCGMHSLAGIEWADGYGTLSETARAQAVHLAATWGWYDRAVATATQQRVFNDYALLYPRPFDREVGRAAKLTGLAPELIYSVMRQESLYRSDAVSAAGARGLLQMLPETARRTARRWKRPRPAADDLFDPGVNVSLGAALLRTLVDRFDGQTIVALAGYNAGANAAARWLPTQAIEADVWIENIPYNETRSYVQRVLWHNVVFAWLESGEPQRTDIWLARVAPIGESRVLGAR